MVICHSETLARSGQAAAISGKRFFVSQKVCFAIKLPKFSAARAKEQEATFYCKRGLPLRKRASVLQVIWLATRSSLLVDRDAATASEGEAKAVRCDSALPPGACFFVLFQFMCQTLGSCPTRTKVRCTNSLC